MTRWGTDVSLRTANLTRWGADVSPWAARLSRWGADVRPSTANLTRRTAVFVALLLLAALPIQAEDSVDASGWMSPSFPYAPVSTPVEATLVSGDGDAMVYRDGIPLSPGGPALASGSMLEAYDLVTVDSGSVTLSLSDATRLVLDEGAVIVLRRGEHSLFHGRFRWYRADNLILRTPMGDLRLVGGGNGRLHPQRVQLSVTEGRAVVANEGTVTAIVAKGRSLVLPLSPDTQRTQDDQEWYSGETDALVRMRERVDDRADRFYAAYQNVVSSYLTGMSAMDTEIAELWSAMDGFLAWYGYVRDRKLPWFEAPDLTTLHIAESLWLVKAAESLSNE